MALRPIRMVKVGLLGLREDEERVLTILHDLRVAQVEPLTPAAMAITFLAAPASSTPVTSVLR